MQAVVARLRFLRVHRKCGRTSVRSGLPIEGSADDHRPASPDHLLHGSCHDPGSGRSLPERRAPPLVHAPERPDGAGNPAAPGIPPEGNLVCRMRAARPSSPGFRTQRKGLSGLRLRLWRVWADILDRRSHCAPQLGRRRSPREPADSVRGVQRAQGQPLHGSDRDAIPVG
jgi:hypothetical protein